MSEIPRFARMMLFPALLIVIVIFVFSALLGGCGEDKVSAAVKVSQYRKEKLARLDPLYEIVNDNGDHGNYIELYRVPTPDGRKIFCIVYSDQIQESGGGAGISCDWSK